MSQKATHVDAHHHFWDLAKFPHDDGFPPEGTVLRQSFLLPQLEAAIADTPIRHTIVVQVLHSYEENEWVLKLVDDFPTVAGIVGWVDLTDPNVEELIDKLKRHPKFCGIRHLTHNEPDHNWLLRDDVQRGLGVLEEKGVPFDLLLKPPNLPAVPSVAQAFPRLKLVIDHIAKPLIKDGVVDPWKEDIAQCAAFPNVFVKLSGMVTEANMTSWSVSDLQDYASHVIAVFGAKRVMYGSDWPVCLLASETYARVYQAYSDLAEGAGCDAADVKQIFRDTAADFYGLKLACV